MGRNREDERRNERLGARRRMLATSTRLLGLSLPSFLGLRALGAGRVAGAERQESAEALGRAGGVAEGRRGGRAKSCILLYCWGGMSHLDTWDLKPDAPAEVRGVFQPIESAVPGIYVSEHLPKLARHTDKLAIVRSIHHDDSAHGRGMYWNLTGHKPPRVGNIPPMRNDWPSLPAMVSHFREAPPGVPRAVRVPYPLVDNDTLQAGEYGGWMGVKYDPIVMRPAAGDPYGGVSRTLGAEVLQLGDVDYARIAERRQLRATLERPLSLPGDFEEFHHFRDLAQGILLGSAVKNAYDLQREDPRVRESYGPHLAGQSMLLARRLTEAGVPIVQVCCAAGDLNGAVGDMWDTHGDNFNRLKDRLLPVFDHAMAALLADLDQRGTLDETLVVMLTDFGRTPRINGGAGRDHYPSVYSIVLAGGGIRGGQVYGSSDALGAFPHTRPCQPPDVHATLFHALGISPRAELRDPLNRPMRVCDGEILPLS
ncbi:MAG: DUF1501 domain-containing protein [Pirellulales bacterium]